MCSKFYITCSGFNILVKFHLRVTIRKLTGNSCMPILYGLILMLLALSKATTIWKENSGMNKLKLVKILVRDQAVYFSMCVHYAHDSPFWIETLLIHQSDFNQHFEYLILFIRREYCAIGDSRVSRKPSLLVRPRSPPSLQLERGGGKGPEPRDKLLLKVSRERYLLCRASGCPGRVAGRGGRARKNRIGRDLLIGGY